MRRYQRNRAPKLSAAIRSIAKSHPKWEAVEFYLDEAQFSYSSLSSLFKKQAGEDYLIEHYRSSIVIAFARMAAAVGALDGIKSWSGDISLINAINSHPRYEQIMHQFKKAKNLIEESCLDP